MHVVVDVDGVVADGRERIKGNVNSFYVGMEHDKPIWPMLDLVRAMYEYGFDITFLTNRPPTVIPITLKWLQDHLHKGTIALTSANSVSRGSDAKLRYLESLERSPDFIIEDDPIIAEGMFKAGYKVLLFRYCPEWDAARKAAYMKFFPEDYHEVVIP